jgi:hypothetical protein
VSRYGSLVFDGDSEVFRGAMRLDVQMIRTGARPTQLCLPAILLAANDLMVRQKVMAFLSVP